MTVAKPGGMGFMVVAVVVSVAVGFMAFALAYDRRKAAEARILAVPAPTPPMPSAAPRPLRVLEVVSLMHVPAPPPLPAAPAQRTLLGIADDAGERAPTQVFVAPTPAAVPVAVADVPTRPSRPAVCAERRLAEGTRPPGYARAATPTDVLSTRIETYIAEAMAAIETEHEGKPTHRRARSRARG